MANGFILVMMVDELLLGRRFGTNRCQFFAMRTIDLRSAVGVINSDSVCDIGEPSSNPSGLVYINLRANVLGESVYLFRFFCYRLNNRDDWDL